MKEHLVYMAMALSLIAAIVLPTEGEGIFWWGCVRGVFVVIFVMLIPTYVRLSNEK